MLRMPEARGRIRVDANGEPSWVEERDGEFGGMVVMRLVKGNHGRELGRVN